MSRPKKVRQVYIELRLALGDEVCAHDLLRSAAMLVDIFDGREVHPGIRHGTPRPTFEELPLDKAFADGGWRVLARESSLLAEVFSEDPQDLAVRRELKSLRMELAT